MMETKQHTPGPWAVDPNDAGLITADKDGLMVAETWNADRSDDEAMANAQLIAAAPTMKEALEAIVARIHGEWDHPSLIKVGTFAVNSEKDILLIAKWALKETTP